ncbi:ABC transporter ATP-binding protein [Nocardioides zeae]|uniref:ABC transporter ATP-binding protein n=1 Tax=Nocardioides imazamoxiresistens TaxID=3231893 RepID=A0ABU3PR50_9ACTN|nr:ABC transporter ATP-binding protein [Nocardioides zeae]MDT9591709.1 ABC transporter ATP-binding protein [Nocardioides zeae]
MTVTDSRPARARRRGAEPAPDAGRIVIRDLRKTYTRNDGTTVPAIDGVDLEVEAGTFCVLLGPSGCGKTTLLRCLAGLEEPASGTIDVGGRPFFDTGSRVSLTPQERRLGMVFQSYALWPHMSVEKNVAFPMTTRRARRHFSRDEVRERVAKALATVDIAELAGQPISALSGGQQQRVALARAIAFGSDVVLFDEPLSNVDAKVRVQLRQEIHALQRELGFTAVYVTHDQEEAMELADVLVVLKKGRIEQAGAPRQLYRTPVSRYVADFVGTADVVEATVVGVEGPGLVAVTSEVGDLVVAAPGEAPAAGSSVGVVVRAEDWRVVPDGAAAAAAGVNEVRGTVRDSAYLGAATQYVVEVGGRTLRVRPQGSALLDEGHALTLRVDASDLHLVP